MATADHVGDLLSRVPRVLLVGDPGQLPPVSGQAVLADTLGVDLITVHRQALDSGVVRFAHAIRAGASVADALRAGAPDVIAGRPAHLPGVLLVGRNDLRMRLNTGVRAQIHTAGVGASSGRLVPVPWPVVGDRLVCLSNHRKTRTDGDDGPYLDDDGRVVEPPDPWCNGTVGDVILADLSKYLSAVKGAVKADTSIHLWFDQNTTAFRFVMRMNGQPWLSAAIARKNGSNTLSHFVTVATR